jgi:hypothetical protein
VIFFYINIKKIEKMALAHARYMQTEDGFKQIIGDEVSVQLRADGALIPKTYIYPLTTANPVPSGSIPLYTGSDSCFASGGTVNGSPKLIIRDFGNFCVATIMTMNGTAAVSKPLVITGTGIIDPSILPASDAWGLACVKVNGGQMGGCAGFSSSGVITVATDFVGTGTFTATQSAIIPDITFSYRTSL